MTVGVQSVVEGPFTPNGVTTVWPFAFTAFADDEVVPLLVTALGGASEPPAVIERTPEGGGEVIIDPPLQAADGDLYILYVPSFAQTTAFEDQARFSPATMNQALDKAASRDQYLKALIDRAVLAPLGMQAPDAGGIIAAIEGARDASLAQVEASVQQFVQANINLDARTQAWIAAVEAAGDAPTIGRALLMNEVILRLEAADAFAWCDGVFAVGETKAQSLVNVIAPGVAATETGGSLPFVADRYLEGNGAAYIETNIAIPSAKYVQDDAFMLVRQVNDHQQSQSRMIGTRGGKAYVVPGTGGPGGPQFHVRVQANAEDPDDSAVFLSNGVGTYGWLRRDSDTFQFMFGVESVATVNRAAASIVVAGNEMLLLAGGAQFGTGRGAYWAFGAAPPTDTQYAELVGALDFYLREIGAAL